MPELYPWLQSAWRQLCASYRGKRFSHATLLHGPAGTGKLELARLLAALVLCQDPREEGACGKCRSCKLFSEALRPDREGGHPEYIELSPTDGRYLIDDIRAISGKLTLTHHSNQHRVVVIAQAECMNPHAANALLHMLEEPPVGSFFILTASERMRIIPTVRSRLKQFLCSAVAHRSQVSQWLNERLTESGLDDSTMDTLHQLCYGAPLRMLEFAREGRMEEVTEFYKLLHSGDDSAAFHCLLAPWAAAAKLRDSLEWLLYLVQSQAISLQSGGQRGTGEYLPKRWLGFDSQQRQPLLGRLHQLGLEIDKSRSLVVNNRHHALMLHGHTIEYRRLLAR